MAGSQSNSTNTRVNVAALSSTKQVSKAYANVGDILTYTVPITNSGNVTANNVLFIDTLPNGTTLVANSFKQDGVAIAGSPNPPGATLLQGIRPLGISIITFQVTVDTIPIPNPIQNNASSSGNFVIDPSLSPNRLGGTSTNTNTVNTQINNANLGNAVKYVDKSYADCGDTINYTIVVPNTGNVTAQNVVFKDTIPNGTSLVSGNFKIDGNQIAGANPTSGVTIPNIPPGISTTITFQVIVQC